MIFSTSLIRHRKKPQPLRRTVSLLLPVLLLLLPLAEARSAESTEIALRLQNTYEKAANLVADFHQTTAMKFSARQRQGTGSVIFLKPGRMRWDYLTPDRQVLISDGTTISMYFEKNAQMIISDARDYLQSDVTYAFFTGSGDILKDFDIAEPDFENDQENTHLIKLVPKANHPQVSSMHAWVNTETFLLTQLEIVDHFETVTKLVFFNVQLNTDFYYGKPISENLFLFTPPVGTEIIRQ